MVPPTSDFKKRPKAKVGKRAPVKVNATDTSFKTANVAVRSQDQSLQKNKNNTKPKDASASNSAVVSLELSSSRGNALSTLQSSLRHHAPAVRVSSLKGIRDAVQSLSSLEVTLGTTVLEANLPSLLPNMCRCWLDEDDDVRSLAIKLFGDIIQYLESSKEQSDLKCLAPFVPILAAYASSALNSLDRSIRKDGSAIVGILASSHPSPSYVTLSLSPIEERKNSAVTTEVGKHMYSFMPPLERLLVSMSLGSRERSNEGSNEGGSKKRKRDENKNKLPSGSSLTAQESVLLTVALLLRASLVAEQNVFSHGSNSGNGNCRLTPSLNVSGESTFLSGGSAHTNSILLFREGNNSINESCSPIRNIFDLPSMAIDETMDERNDNRFRDYSFVGLSRSPKIDASLFEKIQVLDSLLETLRVKFVELIHSGRKLTHDKDGLLMSSVDLDVVDTLIRTMRFIHQHYLNHQSRTSEHHQPKISIDGNQRQPKKRGSKATSEPNDVGQCTLTYLTTVQKTMSLLLESFPIFPMDGKATSRYELTNAGICAALAELGGGDGKLPADITRDSPQWITAVFSYMLPRLDSRNGVKDDSSGEVATNTLLNVLEKLLLPYSFQCDSDCRELVPRYLLSDPLKRQELLEAFAEAFFPRFACVSAVSDITEQKISELASTAVGKTAAMLLVALITQAGDLSNAPIDVEVDLHEKRTVLLLQMSSVLPLYIKSWEGSLPFETGRVLSALIAIVRQWSLKSNGSFVEDFAMCPIKRAINDLCLGLRFSLDSLYTAYKKLPSIFEQLPEQVQKLAVGLIGVIGCPSDALTRSLSKICSKSYGRGEELNNNPCDTSISRDLALYIMEVMHLLRKSLPMPSYLTFVIESSGISHNASTLGLRYQTLGRDKDGKPENSMTDIVFFYDRPIELLSLFLTSSCDQATTKVLPMIIPILHAWLLPPKTHVENIVRELVQARAAFSILAAFVWDDVFSCEVGWSELGIVPREYLWLDDSFCQILVDSIIHQLELAARLWSIGNDIFVDDPIEQFLAHLLGPLTILLRYCCGMLEKLVVCVSSRIVQECKEITVAECRGSTASASGEDVSSNLKVNSSEVLMKTMILILKSKKPASIAELVHNCSDMSRTLLSATVDIDKAVSTGQLSHLGSKLLHQVKVLKR